MSKFNQYGHQRNVMIDKLIEFDNQIPKYEIIFAIWNMT